MPLSRQRRFPGHPTSVRAARHFVSGTLADWGITDRQDDIRLCVSELATNALLHGASAGREFSVRLISDGASVRLEVHDSGPGRPVPQPAVALDSDGGRGLLLVAELADECGVIEHAVGKTVYLTFKLATTLRPSDQS